MLDYAQTFEEFSSSLKPMDLALYSGAAIILYVLFKEQLSPVQNFINDLLSKAKSKLTSEKTKPISIVEVSSKNNDVFLDLIVSWKQTRDLAVKSGCTQAIKVADGMFPYLSPSVCKEENV